MAEISKMLTPISQIQVIIHISLNVFLRVGLQRCCRGVELAMATYIAAVVPKWVTAWKTFRTAGPQLGVFSLSTLMTVFKVAVVIR